MKIDHNFDIDSQYLRSKFEPNHWGRLPVLQIPYAAYRDSKLYLTPSELGVYLVLLEDNKSSRGEDRMYAVVASSLAEIGARTGYSRPTVTKALNGA